MVGARNVSLRGRERRLDPCHRRRHGPRRGHRGHDRKDGGVTPFEHTLVYGGFGVALVLISYFNPPTVRASGAFLLYTGIAVAVSAWPVSVAIGRELAAIVAVRGPRSSSSVSVAASRGTERPATPPFRRPELAGRR